MTFFDGLHTSADEERSGHCAPDHRQDRHYTNDDTELVVAENGAEVGFLLARTLEKLLRKVLIFWAVQIVELIGV